jgi:DNA-binding NarL/FixJ family response regulator
LGAPVRVLVVGVDDDPAFAARARDLGADAWIAKDRADDELPALLTCP